ncbi:MAG: hypothetical protein JWM80_96 [Cyanobacteria bacterium RYN_339]|nr:hypothetical protein [Cyanobacteria bacterium RYN_339]
MRYLFLTFAFLAVGCAHLPTATPVANRAIGCLPGECPPHPQPTTNCNPRTVKAIGCLPGDCPPHPITPPCR